MHKSVTIALNTSPIKHTYDVQVTSAFFCLFVVTEKVSGYLTTDFCAVKCTNFGVLTNSTSDAHIGRWPMYAYVLNGLFGLPSAINAPQICGFYSTKICGKIT